ncbi:MAG: ACT domain-containing protein [Pseudomonadota bacterium]
MHNYLVVSAIGNDQIGIVEKLANLAAKYNCNIIDSRIAVLGGECTAIFMVGGEWNAITQMETAIPTLAQSLNLTSVAKRTNHISAQPELLPYSVRVIALDVPGVSAKISGFFSGNEINIEEFYSHSYKAPITEAPMVKIRLLLSIHTSCHIAELKERFSLFCEENNLDATLSPIHY